MNTCSTSIDLTDVQLKVLNLAKNKFQNAYPQFAAWINNYGGFPPALKQEVLRVISKDRLVNPSPITLSDFNISESENTDTPASEVQTSEAQGAKVSFIKNEEVLYQGRTDEHAMMLRSFRKAIFEASTYNGSDGKGTAIDPFQRIQEPTEDRWEVGRSFSTVNYNIYKYKLDLISKIKSWLGEPVSSYDKLPNINDLQNELVDVLVKFNIKYGSLSESEKKGNVFYRAAAAYDILQNFDKYLKENCSYIKFHKAMEGIESYTKYEYSGPTTDLGHQSFDDTKMNSIEENMSDFIKTLLDYFEGIHIEADGSEHTTGMPIGVLGLQQVSALFKH